MYYLADFAYKPLSKEKLSKIENNIGRQDRIARKHYTGVDKEESIGKYRLNKKNPNLFNQKERMSKLKPDLEGINKSGVEIEKILMNQERLDRFSKDSPAFAERIARAEAYNSKKGLGKKALLGTLGLAGLGTVAYGLNKLRKSRSDKGKIRGNYKK